MTDDRATAIDRVCDALEEAPAGAQGTVRRVMLSPSCRIAYLDLGVVVRARRDEATGIVMWDES